MIEMIDKILMLGSIVLFAISLHIKEKGLRVDEEDRKVGRK
ncbi:hypothetical protein [Marinilactibacillus sp. 15R]|nr:hypothetical protein [Marinilactibacillus sp. 15R]